MDRIYLSCFCSSSGATNYTLCTGNRYVEFSRIIAPLDTEALTPQFMQSKRTVSK